MIHVVLVEPEIPWNAGNVGRTCLAAGAQLHLVRPMGFVLDERHLRRAGLDYWADVSPKVWESWAECEAALPSLGTPYFFSAEATQSYWDVNYPENVALVFGKESSGFSDAIRKTYQASLVKVPMQTKVRSLNLSTTAALAIFETQRQRILKT